MCVSERGYIYEDIYIYILNQKLIYYDYLLKLSNQNNSNEKGQSPQNQSY